MILRSVSCACFLKHSQRPIRSASGTRTLCGTDFAVSGNARVDEFTVLSLTKDNLYTSLSCHMAKCSCDNHSVCRHTMHMPGDTSREFVAPRPMQYNISSYLATPDVATKPEPWAYRGLIACLGIATGPGDAENAATSARAGNSTNDLNNTSTDFFTIL